MFSLPRKNEYLIDKFYRKKKKKTEKYRKDKKKKSRKCIPLNVRVSLNFPLSICCFTFLSFPSQFSISHNNPKPTHSLTPFTSTLSSAPSSTTSMASLQPGSPSLSLSLSLSIYIYIYICMYIYTHMYGYIAPLF